MFGKCCEFVREDVQKCVRKSLRCYDAQKLVIEIPQDGFGEGQSTSDGVGG
jgi:hypothetical protein